MLYRELQRPAAGRTVERDAVHVAGLARVALGCWRADYNHARPHSQLGWKTPSEFAFTHHPRRDLALRYAEGSAPASVASTALSGKSNNPTARQNSGLGSKLMPTNGVALSFDDRQAQENLRGRRAGRCFDRSADGYPTGQPPPATSGRADRTQPDDELQSREWTLGWRYFFRGINPLEAVSSNTE